ncbi:Uncharacterized protein dnm_022850 [Desulfonema magnum]|uniref:Uncharacterized protein n=1 Tax=Desulfonema magnum TaxID=45655 RepID=A0A975GM31_9BACT|nr:Uncharacterized protein dnm_022850 [Desulfonema magnum]
MKGDVKKKIEWDSSFRAGNAPQGRHICSIVRGPANLPYKKSL